MSKPSITVITPTIPGRESLLDQCEQSVISQGVPVDKHLVKVDFLLRGPAATRNAMLEKVETDWVIFLDDDDILYDDYVETVVPYLEDYDVVYTWCHRNFSGLPDAYFDPESLRHANHIPVTAAVRMSLVNEVGGFPDGPYEDWKLWLALLDEGARFKTIPKKKWFYRRSDEGHNFADRKKLGLI